MVLDDQRRSRRFGFVSFSKAEEAERVLKQGSVYLMGKKINVGPAVKKEVRKFVYNFCFSYKTSVEENRAFVPPTSLFQIT